MSDRQPIQLGPQTYAAPIMSTAHLEAWFDELLRDQERVLATSLQLAVEAGEIDDVDNVDEVFVQAARASVEARSQFRALLTRLAPRDPLQ